MIEARANLLEGQRHRFERRRVGGHGGQAVDEELLELLRPTKYAGRWKRPIAGLGWYRATKKAFAELPED